MLVNIRTYKIYQDTQFKKLYIRIFFKKEIVRAGLNLPDLCSCPLVECEHRFWKIVKSVHAPPEMVFLLGQNIQPHQTYLSFAGLKS